MNDKSLNFPFSCQIFPDNTHSNKLGLIQVFVVYSCVVESIWRYMSEKIVYYHHKANVTSNKTNATVIRTFSTDHKIPNDGDRCLLIISR